MIEISFLHSQPFTSDQYHFLIIVESVTYQMLPQQPKQLICQKMWSFSKTKQPDTAHIKHKNSRCGFTMKFYTLQPIVLTLPVSILFRLLKLHLRGHWYHNRGGIENFYSWITANANAWFLPLNWIFQESVYRWRVRASEWCIWKDMVEVTAKSEVLSPSLYCATWGR